MIVFPVLFGYPRWLYLLVFVGFIIVAFLFNRFLRHSLRHGPRWGKSSPRPVSRTSSVPLFSSDAALFSKLVNVCFGDRSKAERLILLEQRRDSRLSRAAAIQAALDSVRYDNRH